MYLKEPLEHKQMWLMLTIVDFCSRLVTMIDDFRSQEGARSSGELWTEICSSLPGSQAAAAPEVNTEFRDSFEPAAQVGVQVNGHSNGTNDSSSDAIWEPMEDSDIYIASLGTYIFPALSLHPQTSSMIDNRNDMVLVPKGV